MLIQINSKLNNKNIFLICIAFLLVVTFSFFISGADACCEKTNSGAWCQLTDISECAPSPFSHASTSCEQTLFCKKGTCVNENSGACSSNTPKAVCQNQGGTWYDKDKDEIPACKIGCCILGQEVAFVNPATCQQLATDYEVDVDFMEGITSQSQCFSLDTTIDEGACVLKESTTAASEEGIFSNLFGGGNQEINTQTSIDCKRTTQSGCSSLGGIFHKGLLCSAQELSDCAKSKETKCENDKVYFKDTCGNKANVYDKERYNDVNYWNEIQNSECSVGGIASSTCGDCSYRLGTICAEYDKNQAGKGMPDKAPLYGNNVCRELSCYYDTNNNEKIEKEEKYLHGEQWCAESPGTYFHVPFIMDNSTKNILREGYNNYNLPGSRYYKLKCYDGEVIPEPCSEFRNSICKESIDPRTDKRVAACFVHESATCLTYNTKTLCEEKDDCKWVPGYTLNGTIVGDGELEFGTKLEEYNEKQGTCYPLFTPGTTFWSKEGEDVCIKSSGVVEKALFETGVGVKREEFADYSIKDATNRCIDGCYAIPGYGSKDGKNYLNIEDLKKFQLGTGDLGASTQDIYLSKREGYYCKNKPDEPDTIDNTKTGPEKGDTIECKDNEEKDLARKRVKPFYTHEQWLKTIRERTRSISDCGYKPHAYSSITNWLGDPDSEKITVIFEKLKQSKEVKKTFGERKVLYTGDETTPRAGYRK